jgi:hypothetical protein
MSERTAVPRYPPAHCHIWLACGHSMKTGRQCEPGEVIACFGCAPPSNHTVIMTTPHCDCL